MSLQLIIIAGPDQGRAFTLQAGPNLMLGRGSSSLYRLTDARASRSHCQIVLDGDQATIIDNDSSSGTFINGVKVERRLLKLGDVIQVGATQLRLAMGDFPLDIALAALEPASRAAATPAPPQVDKLAALSGQVLGHYDVGPVIGQGSTGMVFHATDTKDQTSVALKVLLPEISKNEEEMQRFVRAMKTVLPLRHPNLVTLYAAGKTGGYCWMAMEYVAGEVMTGVIERIGVAGMLDWRYAFKVALHIGRALSYAHARQILHRNVTPRNVLLQATDKVVKLGDLMIAKALGGTMTEQITRPGQLVGDVVYMSPERTRGLSEVDGRSDIYGLGATVYALLTGRPPFAGNTLVEQITRIRQTPPVAPTKYQMSIPPAFEGTVLKMLAKRPEDRYATADKLVVELERIGKAHAANA
ncbi:MAG TPA: FHA domain-containing serine/threonine-protein kinase [Gemmataceae bacterium]|jgi:serine/threonine protein kinase|nr:FHA domain-containing serine/threonine-protein kinase [Gemmataceae bacterium]